MTLDAQIRELLAQMSVLSEVPAARTGDIIHGGEKSTAPKGPRRSMAEEFQVRYNGARSDRGRREVIAEARKAYDHAKARAIPKERPASVNDPQWKMWVGFCELSVAEIVRLYSVSRQYVHRIRRAYGSSAEQV